VTRSDPPDAIDPAFRDRSGWGDFAAPSLREVADEARWLGDPPVAVVAVVASKCSAATGLLVTPYGSFTDHDRLILEWIGSIETSGPARVPASLRPHFGSHRALAVPMRSATWTVGALALPLRPGWGPVARELEGLGSDFASRFEAAHRRAEIVFLRVASVGRRPAGRREDVPSTPRTSVRQPLGASVLRGRGGRHVSGVRRLELPSAVGKDVITVVRR